MKLRGLLAVLMVVAVVAAAWFGRQAWVRARTRLAEQKSLAVIAARYEKEGAMRAVDFVEVNGIYDRIKASGGTISDADFDRMVAIARSRPLGLARPAASHFHALGLCSGASDYTPRQTAVLKALARELLKSDDPLDKRAALTAAREAKDESFVPLALPLLHHPDPFVRSGCKKTLAELGYREETKASG